MNMVDKKPKVIVLFEGYSTQIDDATMDANCTCTLITTQRKKIIVDTMTAWDGKEIISALAKHAVKPVDINVVVCSHSHADHIGNNNLFLGAQEHIVGTTVHNNTIFYEKNISEREYKICDGVKIIATPGHTSDDVTVIVDGVFNKEEVTVAVAGDLFEKEEDLSNPSIWMNLGAPGLQETQAESRCRIAHIADIIIPGHGPAFRITKKIREKLSQQFEEIKSKKK